MLERSVTRSHLKPLSYPPLHNLLPSPLIHLLLPYPQILKTSLQTSYTTPTPPMSHHSTHLRSLAKSSQDPKTSMDPTHKKHPKSPPFINTTTITTKPHPKPQEPTNIYSPNVQNISNHFSRLYSNHKALSSSNPSRTGPPHPQPSLDTHFQAKPMSLSTISDGPVSKGTRKYRRNITDLDGVSPKASLGAAKKPIKKSSEEILDTKREIKTDDFKKSSTTKKEIVVVETKNQEIEVLKRPSVLVAAGGRRKSFCSSKTELADFLSCNGVKVVSADMPPFMQIHAVDFARKTYDSLEKFTAKTLASTLKKEFDGVYGPAWHCIVGTSFGSFVTHSVGGFLYFSMDHKLYILLFKTTVQKAE